MVEGAQDFLHEREWAKVRGRFSFDDTGVRRPVVQATVVDELGRVDHPPATGIGWLFLQTTDLVMIEGGQRLSHFQGGKEALPTYAREITNRNLSRQ